MKGWLQAPAMANRVHPDPASFTQLEGKPAVTEAPPTPTQHAFPEHEQPPPSRIPVEEECEPPVPLSRGDSSPRIWTGRKKTLRGVPLQEAAAAAAALGAGDTAAPLDEPAAEAEAGIGELDRGGSPSKELERGSSKSLLRADSGRALTGTPPLSACRRASGCCADLAAACRLLPGSFQPC